MGGCVAHEPPPTPSCSCREHLARTPAWGGARHGSSHACLQKQGAGCMQRLLLLPPLYHHQWMHCPAIRCRLHVGTLSQHTPKYVLRPWHQGNPMQHGTRIIGWQGKQVGGQILLWSWRLQQQEQEAAGGAVTQGAGYCRALAPQGILLRPGLHCQRCKVSNKHTARLFLVVVGFLWPGVSFIACAVWRQERCCWFGPCRRWHAQLGMTCGTCTGWAADLCSSSTSELSLIR